MSVRRPSDDENAALLQPGSSDSSSGRQAQQLQLPPPTTQSGSVRLPENTAKSSRDDEESHRPRRPPPPGRCSKSATVTMLLILTILGGMLVFLLLTPPKVHHKKQMDARATNYSRESSAHSASNRAQNDEGSEEQGRKVAAHGSHRGVAHGAPVNRQLKQMERMEGWFMERPKRSVSDYILSGNEPLNYNLFLIARIRGWNGADETRLDGEVEITIRHTDGDPRRIVLNSLHNIIEQVQLTDDSEPRNEIDTKFTVDVKKERLIVKTYQSMERGSIYRLKIWYKTTPDKRMRGTYESWVWNEAEQRKVYSVHLHNEPMDARRWLPSFDEPIYKVPLTLRVSHPSGLNVVANSGVQSSYAPIKGRKRITTSFFPTPPLPTYLYCFSINNYKQFSVVKDGIKFSTYLARREEMYGNSSVEMLVSAVGNISILYPGRLLMSPANGTGYTHKLDMIYAPDHHSAMENQGIIMSDDRRLLTGPWNMIVHETAHHIFGNLLTLKWWSDTWMNEGLTSKVEFEVLCMLSLGNLTGEDRKVKQDKWYWDRSSSTLRHDIYALTSAALSNPSVLSREEAKYMFSNAYFKGALVLRMFEVWDADAYNKTLEYLLANHSMGTIDQRLFCDLFGQFSTSAASRDICNDFSFENTYPILDVRKRERGYEVKRMKFHRGYVDETYRDASARWTVPLSIRRKIAHSDEWGPREKRVMRREDDVIFIDADGPILINGDGQFYYRVIYDDYTPFYTTGEKLANNSRLALIQDKLLDDATHALLTGYLDPYIGFRFAMNCGLPYQVDYFSVEFAKLLYGHLMKSQLDELPVMQVVEQLFNISTAYPEYWSGRRREGEGNRHTCKSLGVNTIEDMIDAYTKGRTFGWFSEEGFMTSCARFLNVSHQQSVDWIMSALSPYDGPIRAKDATLGIFTALSTFDEVLQSVNERAYNIKISDDDFTYYIQQLFTFRMIPNLDTVIHFVKLRPESMRTQWDVVAKAVEMNRMQDLEFEKLGNTVSSALITILLHEKEGFNLDLLKRKTDPVENVRNRGLKYQKLEDMKISDEIYPYDEEGFNSQEEIMISNRLRRHFDMTIEDLGQALKETPVDAPI